MNERQEGEKHKEKRKGKHGTKTMLAVFLFIEKHKEKKRKGKHGTNTRLERDRASFNCFFLPTNNTETNKDAHLGFA